MAESNTKKFKLGEWINRLKGDKVVWIIVILLVMISILCMFSSTSRLLKGDATRIDILWEQLKTVLFGAAALLLAYNIRDVKYFRWIAILGFPASFILLLMVAVLHVDFGVVRAINLNEAWRILQVGGIQVHVLEVAKVAMVMYLAWAQYAVRQDMLPFKEKLSKMWRKVIFVYVPFLLMIVVTIPASISSTIIIAGMMFLILLMGGGNAKELFVAGFAAIALLLLCFGIYKMSDGEYMDRIGTGIERVFEDNSLHEERFLKAVPYTKEYYAARDEILQPYSAKIAIHQGGVFGKMPGQSTQRYVVPDISEDYMFSFIVEEYGLFGALIIIVLYISLVARASIIVRGLKNDLFAQLCVGGLCLLISGQAFLHMFVNADIGPMTGQTLPMVSHGTSAFICFSFAFGVILSLSRLAKQNTDKESRNAEPLMELHDRMPDGIKEGLDDLDAFESGIIDNEDEI